MNMHIHTSTREHIHTPSLSLLHPPRHTMESPQGRVAGMGRKRQNAIYGCSTLPPDVVPTDWK